MTNDVNVSFKEQAYEVESQAAAITDDSLAEAGALIGIYLRDSQGTVEITRDYLKDCVEGIGCDNPLFLSGHYARATRWGKPVFPTFLLPTDAIAPRLRGVQWIFSGWDWDFFQAIKLGDQITFDGRLAAAKEISGKTVTRMIIQTGERAYRNQNDQVVASARTHVMRIPRSKAAGGMNYESRTPKYSPADLERISSLIHEETFRGADVRYWEDVSEGEELGPIARGPLRLSEIAFILPGFGIPRPKTHAYLLEHRRRHPADTYLDPETGVQDHPHRGHWESFMAREVGMPGVYDTGTPRLSWLGILVSDWMGDDGFLKRLSGRVRRPCIVGDTTFVSGRVTSKYQENNDHLVDIELVGVNQDEEVTTTGSATVRLMSRSI